MTVLLYLLAHLDPSAAISGYRLVLRQPAEAVYLEISTLRRSGDEAAFWTAHLNRDETRSRKQWNINCSRRTYLLYSVLSYDRDYKLVAAGAVPPEERGPFSIFDGTNISALQRVACSSVTPQ